MIKGYWMLMVTSPRVSLDALIENLKSMPPKRVLRKEAISLWEEPIPPVEMWKASQPKKLQGSVLAIDAASVSIYVPAGEVAVTAGALLNGKNIVTHPSPALTSSRGPPFMGAPTGVDLSWITYRYLKISIPYAEDPLIPEGAIAHDIRINLETQLIRKAADLGVEGVLLIDGPSVYPFTQPAEGSKWSTELGLLNEDRVDVMIRAFRKGLIPVCVVKRIWGASQIPEASRGGVRDVEVIIGRLGGRIPEDVPVVFGPWESRTRVGLPDRIMAYVIVPHHPYLRNYSIFRVEFLRDVAESLGDGLKDLIASVAWLTKSYGTYVPPSLHVVDKVSKELVSQLSKMVESKIRLSGIPILYGGGSLE